MGMTTLFTFLKCFSIMISYISIPPTNNLSTHI
jgi:hypothetical protein